MTKQWIFVGLVVAGLAGGALIMTQLGNEVKPVAVGSVAPDFKAVDLATGDSVSLHERYRGKVTLINIWATWCAPCRAEMPSIERLHREFGPRGLKIVAVSVDDPGQQKAVRDFARELGLTFEILHDPTHDIQKTYQTTGVPETFVLGRDGVIRKKIIGATDWSSPGTRALVAQLLAER
jgi:cytochrome c biogenesis protein CcmG, thiol:disulfide interchange protein DsbE